MIKRIPLMTFLALVLSVGATTVSAQWKDLGSREVKQGVEEDTWRLNSFQGQFRKIKLTVTHNKVKFLRLEIEYKNGETDRVEIKKIVNAGGSTRVIDLRGDDRYLSRVNVWYEAVKSKNDDRPRVTLWGFK